MKKMGRVSIFCLMLGLSSFCEAAGNGHGFLIGMHQPKLESNGVSTDSQFTPMLGIAFYETSYEYDLLYTQKVFAPGTTTYTTFQVPLMLRIQPSNSWSVGLGAYLDYMTNAPSGAKALDYGGALSIQIMLGTSFFVDLRYLYGVVDLPGKTRDLQILLGFMF